MQIMVCQQLLWYNKICCLRAHGRNTGSTRGNEKLSYIYVGGDDPQRGKDGKATWNTATGSVRMQMW
ncbi:hypothetical protein V6Z11_A09G226800 [Gossypium hirsutum]